MAAAQDTDGGAGAFPISFRGFDPDAVHARLAELERRIDELLLEAARARSEARLAELDAALAGAADGSVPVAVRAERVEAALARARQAVDEVRRVRSSS